MSSEPIAVAAQGVSKTYRMGVGRARIREMIPPPVDGAVRRLAPRWWEKNTFRALEDVSFEVPRGTSAALVGHNGAGKTTLLKIVSGITEATAGEGVVHGRLAALIDSVVGFHPDLTGRENVYLLGALHGVKRREMRARMDDVFAFAEIRELADTPVKRFSAGMTARLGFATIAVLSPDVLLIDEVLAVGDVSFQRRCVEWLDGFREAGGTLLFVSHNLHLVRNMTEYAVWLHHGSVREIGQTGEVLSSYGRAMERRSESDRVVTGVRSMRRNLRSSGQDRWGAGGLRFDSVDVDQKGPRIDVHFAFSGNSVDRAVFSVGLIDESGEEVGGCASSSIAVEGATTARCVIDPLPLTPGIYFPVITIRSGDGRIRDRWKLERAVVIDDDEGIAYDSGPIRLQGRWSVAGINDG
jgi:ABC-type polysaccharide/polyol phosphate transport system ATPase subunit